MKKTIVLFLAALTFAFSAPSQAAPSHRTTHELGFYGSLLGDPWPSLIGANVGYNVIDIFRFHAGLSYIPGVLIVGGGVKALVPGWNFSPMVGLGGGLFLGTGDFGGATGNLAYFSAGFDYTAENGFNIGFGINTGVTESTDALPYLAVGFYFDEL